MVEIITNGVVGIFMGFTVILFLYSLICIAALEFVSLSHINNILPVYSFLRVSVVVCFIYGAIRLPMLENKRSD